MIIDDHREYEYTVCWVAFRGGERGHCPPLKTGWLPLGYVACIVTYIIFLKDS